MKWQHHVNNYSHTLPVKQILVCSGHSAELPMRQVWSRKPFMRWYSPLIYSFPQLMLLQPNSWNLGKPVSSGSPTGFAETAGCQFVVKVSPTVLDSLSSCVQENSQIIQTYRTENNWSSEIWMGCERILVSQDMMRELNSDGPAKQQSSFWDLLYSLMNWGGEETHRFITWFWESHAILVQVQGVTKVISQVENTFLGSIRLSCTAFNAIPVQQIWRLRVTQKNQDSKILKSKPASISTKV